MLHLYVVFEKVLYLQQNPSIVMKCPKCNSEIEAGSKFCNHCGTNIQARIEQMKRKENRKDFLSSTLLLIWAIVVFVCVVVNAIITKTTDMWINPWRTVYTIIAVIQNLACLLIPFAVKKVSYKVVVFVLAGLFVSYWIIMNIKFMIN